MVKTRAKVLHVKTSPHNYFRLNRVNIDIEKNNTSVRKCMNWHHCSRKNKQILSLGRVQQKDTTSATIFSPCRQNTPKSRPWGKYPTVGDRILPGRDHQTLSASFADTEHLLITRHKDTIAIRKASTGGGVRGGWEKLTMDSSWTAHHPLIILFYLR